MDRIAFLLTFWLKCYKFYRILENGNTQLWYNTKFGQCPRFIVSYFYDTYLSNFN